LNILAVQGWVITSCKYLFLALILQALVFVLVLINGQVHSVLFGHVDIVSNITLVCLLSCGGLSLLAFVILAVWALLGIARDAEAEVDSLGHEQKPMSDLREVVEEVVKTARLTAIATMVSGLSAVCLSVAMSLWLHFLSSRFITFVFILMVLVDFLSNASCALLLSGLIGSRLREDVDTELKLAGRLAIARRWFIQDDERLS